MIEIQLEDEDSKGPDSSIDRLGIDRGNVEIHIQGVHERKDLSLQVEMDPNNSLNLPQSKN